MALIYVRTKPDSFARATPGGAIIPSDKYIPIQDTPRIRRMIEVHGDVEEKPLEKPPVPVKEEKK